MWKPKIIVDILRTHFLSEGYRYRILDAGEDLHRKGELRNLQRGECWDGT